MKTITDELREIAMQCISSKEFTKRAKKFLHSKLTQDIMTDVELRDIYRNVSHNREIERAWEKYKNTIYPALSQRADCKKLWYETWIDLEETWIDKWLSAFHLMKDNEIIEACAKYLNEQERYYDSQKATYTGL